MALSRFFLRGGWEICPAVHQTRTEKMETIGIVLGRATGLRLTRVKNQTIVEAKNLSDLRRLGEGSEI